MCVRGRGGQECGAYHGKSNREGGREVDEKEGEDEENDVGEVRRIERERGQGGMLTRIKILNIYICLFRPLKASLFLLV